MSSEQSNRAGSQESLWKLVYRILSPNEVRPEEETQPMSFAACQREAERIRQSLGVDYALQYIKVVNVDNPQDQYSL